MDLCCCLCQTEGDEDLGDLVGRKEELGHLIGVLQEFKLQGQIQISSSLNAFLVIFSILIGLLVGLLVDVQVHRVSTW